tara:strand:+ start:459 stop:977 length:519 start_codon:yes stop_codon:yes gene_type:complete
MADGGSWPTAEAMARVHAVLEGSGLAFEIMDCDPDLADTAVFCERYDVPLTHSANAIVVKAKTGEAKFAACLVLATCRLDVNHTVRKKLEARKVSFATPEETRDLTGMEIGGVTPLGLPDTLPLWIDARVMELDYVILGGGGRDTKIRVDPAIFRQTPVTVVVEGLAKEIDG